MNKSMKELVIKISPKLEFIKHVPNIDWSILVNKIISAKLERVFRFQEIISKSKLTEEDVNKLSNSINESLSKRYI